MIPKPKQSIFSKTYLVLLIQIIKEYKKVPPALKFIYIRSLSCFGYGNSINMDRLVIFREKSKILFSNSKRIRFFSKISRWSFNILINILQHRTLFFFNFWLLVVRNCLDFFLTVTEIILRITILYYWF